MEHKIYIICGHYGSGKSEFAVNFAKKLKTDNTNVVLADLDIVNPYFRSREIRLSLENLGIDVISDTLNSIKGLDMPYLSPAIKGQIMQKDRTIVLDCGGDPVGCRVLKQFSEDIKKRDYEMYMILNVFRPETSNVEDIIAMKNKLEQESTLKITGLINNSNFIWQTTVEDLIYADKIIKQVSILTNIPIIYVAGLKSIINKLPESINGTPFELELHLRSNWL